MKVGRDDALQYLKFPLSLPFRSLSLSYLAFSNAILSLQHQIVLSPFYFPSSSSMPTISSQRTGPAARRQRRRARQRQKLFSTAFPHRQRNHRRSIPKRQLRQQSADVGDCFEDCQEFGYHLDPDVQVGNLVAQGNPFSLLEPDHSNYSTPDPIPTPYQDHTIQTPNQFLAECDWHIAKKSSSKLEDVERPIRTQAGETKAPLQRVTKFCWHSHGQTDDLEANPPFFGKALPQTARHTVPASVETCDITATPPSGASVKLPGFFPQETAPASSSRISKKRKLNDSPPASSLTADRVPSPLLYHRPNQDMLPTTDDQDNTCTCLPTSFEHTREEYQSNYGPKSHSILHRGPSTDLEAEATGSCLQYQYQLPAAALPNEGTATPFYPVENAIFCSDPDFYTNTRPYLSPRRSPINSKAATGGSTPRTARTLTSLGEAKKFASQICVAKELILTEKPFPTEVTSLPPVSVQARSSVLQQPRPLIPNPNWVFPDAPSSTVSPGRILDRYLERNINFWPKQNDANEQKKVDSVALYKDTVEYFQDGPSKFQDLWDSYEKAVLGHQNQKSASTRGLSALSNLLRPLPTRSTLPIADLTGPPNGSILLPAPIRPFRPSPVDLELPKEIDNAVWASTACTTLIPATLNESQYLGLRRHINTEFWNLDKRTLLVSNTILEQIKDTRSHEQIQQAVDWLIENLELEKVFDDEPEDEGSCLPWLQAGWDGHLFYPEAVASEIPLPLLSLFEDVDLSDEGQIGNSDSCDGIQVNEEAEEDMWWDWDDEASSWSEPSEDGFFHFDL